MIFRVVNKSRQTFYRFVTIHACDRLTQFSSLDRVCMHSMQRSRNGIKRRIR